MKRYQSISLVEEINALISVFTAITFAVDEVLFDSYTSVQIPDEEVVKVAMPEYVPEADPQFACTWNWYSVAVASPEIAFEFVVDVVVVQVDDDVGLYCTL